MSFAFRLEDYTRYQERVGEATYLDISRRTDPACVPRLWDNLRAVLQSYGPPWVVQVWTKDPAAVAVMGGDLLRELAARGTTVTAQVTVTGLAGTLWEPRVPPDGFSGVGALADLIGGPSHVVWRYDPIIPTVHRAETFRSLAQRATDAGIRRAVINFIAAPGRYARVDRRLAPLLPGWLEGMPDYDAEWRRRTAAELVGMAREEGLDLGCCAESAGLAAQVEGLRRAACGDAAWFAELSGRAAPEAPARASGSRPGCGCAPYFDLGYYGQWRRCHGCAYCYAG